MFLIVGLGNPGAKYAANRHNIGFMAVDEIHRRHGFSGYKTRFQGMAAEGVIDGVKTLLLKPTTFMNESGRSVQEACKFYKIEPDDVVVIYDELDLAPGRVRVKKGGGSGGHNGIKSLDAHIGKEYRRVRLGIGHPGDKNQVSDYVLSDFHKADQAWLDPLLNALASAVNHLARGEDGHFLNKLSLELHSSEPRSARGQRDPAAKPAKKVQSHILQARANGPKELPKSGPMADILKKLFGGKDG